MDSVFERAEIQRNTGKGEKDRQTIGPTAVKKWTAILRPLGTIEVIDEAGEVVTPEAMQ